MGVALIAAIAIAALLGRSESFVPVNPWAPWNAPNNTVWQVQQHGQPWNTSYVLRPVNATNYFNYPTTGNGGMTYAAPGGHHLILGQIGPNDRLLFKKNFAKTAIILGKREKEIDFPSFSTPGMQIRFMITAIRAIDHYTNGMGGYAQILKGGIGHKRVQMLLQSQRGHGFNHTVEIYGS